MRHASTFASPSRKPGRVLALLGFIAAVLYGGTIAGPFSSVALLRQRRAIRAATKTRDSLRAVRDSLTAVEWRLGHDPEMQEAEIRESFGFVRGDHELVYRLVPARDSEVLRGARGAGAMDHRTPGPTIPANP